MAKRSPRNGNNGKTNSPDTLDFRDKLWLAADELRGSIDAAEYKHVVLGLIFLKYISDTFAGYRGQLDKRSRDKKSDWYCATEKERAGLLEDRDEYTAAGVFWVPPGARWPEIKASAKQPNLAQRIDDAMYAIEEANPKRLKGVLPRNYAGKGLPPERLGKLIDIISGIELYKKVEDGGQQDLIGRVYEYFLGKFAAAEGKLGGEFYTPRCVVRVLVEMIEPFKGRVFDPCCGSGGMFVQSEEFIRDHRGNIKDISVYGQESNPTTWKLCRMNLAIHGLEANLGPRQADSFLEDLHPDLRADFILANPPFNISSWNGELLRKDARWEYGIPPAGNANYAWIQHFIYHLAPPNGRGGGIAGFVMANGSLSTSQSGEGEIRKRIVEADLVDCIVAMPGQLFLTTGIPVCLWFLRKGKGKKGDQTGEKTLFIDARKLGTMETRTLRVLSDADIARIADTYHAWRGTASAKEKGLEYADIPGFCRSASRKEIEEHGFVLTPGRYVGAEDAEEDAGAFAERFPQLLAQLEAQFSESSQLVESIRSKLGRLVPQGTDT
jgi:type I restriction enzyme M protein